MEQTHKCTRVVLRELYSRYGDHTNANIGVIRNNLETLL